MELAKNIKCFDNCADALFCDEPRSFNRKLSSFNHAGVERIRQSYRTVGDGCHQPNLRSQQMYRRASEQGVYYYNEHFVMVCIAISSVLMFVRRNKAMPISGKQYSVHKH